MSNFDKTTGKIYDPGAKKCAHCGHIFPLNKTLAKRKTVRCPRCGSKDTERYQQTTAVLPQE